VPPVRFRLASNALIGCSILLIPLLKNIPIAVLSGLFLHLGIQTAKGNQVPVAHYFGRPVISCCLQNILLEGLRWAVA
jgi:MFS superfamily sulfate permease-like transporter